MSTPGTDVRSDPPIPDSHTDTVDVGEPTETNFVETALVLGGKSLDEARTTGAIDRADEQVEALFDPRYQTIGSPVHQATWERRLPLELFAPHDVSHDTDVEQVMA
ncbi:MAG: hypothetical protein VYA62_04900, partial [Planctomycetota bacterium]|nr:hypothetical protein [Planctomycetota bacterium]